MVSAPASDPSGTKCAICDCPRVVRQSNLTDKSMPQIFHPATNAIARVSILGGVGILTLTGWLLLAVGRSDYATEVNVVRGQPVEFSHEHHVGGLGIDCRFCHTGAEDSNMAGLPPTETCMECH